MTQKSASVVGRFTGSRVVVAVTQNNAVFLLVLGGVFALARLATWGFPYDSDHWIFFYVGNNWIVDGGQLYVDAWDHKPPMIFLMNGLMAALLGDNIVLHRIWLTAFALLDIWLFYLLTKRVLPNLLNGMKSPVDKDVAVKLTVLPYVFVRNLSQFTNSGNNTEAYGLVLVLLLVLAFLKFTETGAWWWLVLAGFWCGLLFWFKGNFLIFGAIVGVLLLAHGWRTPGKLALQVFMYIAPIVLVSLAWVVYFQAVGTFDDFWLASFGFSALYATTAWSGSLSANVWLFITTAGLLVPALVGIVLYLRDLRTQWRNPNYQLIGLMFLAGLVIIGAVGSFYAYYLLITMPFTVLVIAYGLFRISDVKQAWRVLLIAGFVSALLVNYAFSTRQLLNNFSGTAAAAAAEQRQAADYIRERTSPEDRIYANAYGAVFYQLAGRDSASRFISSSVLLLDYREQFGLGFNDIFMSEMEQHQAKYVMVDGGTADLYAQNSELERYFAEHFAPVKTFGDTVVLERVK